MRKLVTVQTIGELRPIEGADRIEAARVLGWTVVVGKGEFQVGERVAYFEIDSFLRGDRPEFASFLSRGSKVYPIDGVDVEGHVLRTAKLRGVVSQGLVMPLAPFAEDIYHWAVEAGEAASTDPEWEPFEGMDITEALGVVKWEPPLPVGSGDILGPFDTRFAPKTDAIRLQSIAQAWELIQAVEWEPTVKVDGTSQTLVNDDGALRIFGRNWELDTATSSGFTVASRSGLTDAIEPGMAIQFELVGSGIQGNKLKLQTQQAIVFAVWRDGVKLPRSEWPSAALEHATPVLGEEFLPANFGSSEELVSFVDGLKGSITRDIRDEGVVYHPVDPNSVPTELGQLLDRNCNWKVISNSFLLKHKE